MLVTPPVCNSTLIGGPRLHDPGLLAPFLGLSFLRWEVSPLFHHFLPFLIPFSLFIGGVNLGDLGGGKGGRLKLYCLFKSVPPNVGLQQVQEAHLWLAL